MPFWRTPTSRRVAPPPQLLRGDIRAPAKENEPFLGEALRRRRTELSKSPEGWSHWQMSRSVHLSSNVLSFSMGPPLSSLCPPFVLPLPLLLCSLFSAVIPSSDCSSLLSPLGARTARRSLPRWPRSAGTPSPRCASDWNTHILALVRLLLPLSLSFSPLCSFTSFLVTSLRALERGAGRPPTRLGGERTPRRARERERVALRGRGRGRGKESWMAL